MDRLEDKMNTKLFENENAEKCHVQGVDYELLEMKYVYDSLNFPIMKDEYLFSFLRVQRE